MTRTPGGRTPGSGAGGRDGPRARRPPGGGGGCGPGRGAGGVDGMSVRPPGGAEENLRFIERFYASCGLEGLRTREPEPFKEQPAPPRGAAAIDQALRNRLTTMRNRLNTLENRLRTF